MTLNLSNYRVVFSDDFANDTSLNSELWSDSWGYASQYSFSGGALTLTSYASEDYYPVAIMQNAVGKSAGEGYGLYQFTGYLNANQGKGIDFLLWRADNQFLDASQPYIATEIDVLESWDGTHTGESTLHWYDPSWPNDSAYQVRSYPNNLDLTQPHTYAVDWERGSLTFYIDGNEIYQNTADVPKDYADGGSNEVMGAQVVYPASTSSTSSVALHIVSMSYSAPANATAEAQANPTLAAGQNFAASAGDTVTIGAGDDTVSALGGYVTVQGGAGSFVFSGGAGPNTVLGGSGAETIYGGAGGGVFTGGSAGGNVLVSQGAYYGNTTLTGSGYGNRIFGSASGRDVLAGGLGHDTILGGGSTTSITGGSAASSVIFAGAGATTVFGGAAGGDTVVGGSGTLSVEAHGGDEIFAGAGTLLVSGSNSGADFVGGGSGALNVTGNGGGLEVAEGAGAASISTGSGAALVFGGPGSSTVTGGAGSLQVSIGRGAMTVNEGAGPTLYDVTAGSAGGSAVLDGFRPGSDRVELFGYAASGQQVTSSGGSTTISLSDGTKIELVGVSNPGGSIIG